MTPRNPGVVALQEMNGFTPAQLEAEAKHWGHPYSVLLEEDGFPTALTSRTPITEVRRIRDGMHHGLLHGKICGIHFYVIHFHPSHHARRIDYIFVSPNLANSAQYTTVVRDPLTTRLSDHYPPVAELEVPSNPFPPSSRRLD